MARLTTLAALMIAFCNTFAQTRPLGVKVLYDPMLWKQQLRLNDEQCNHIRLINADYYEAIGSLHDFRADRDSLQNLNRKLLFQRSEQLWNVLRPRQQHKWQKIHLPPAGRRVSSKGLTFIRNKRTPS